MSKTPSHVVHSLNPQQRKAAQAPEVPLLIVAGAGTGKTRTLTSRILHLVGKGVSPERICALTFTNKAALEMLERVESATARLRGGPLISTFHSLGARILRKEAALLGRTPRFIIFDDHDASSLLKKVLKGIERKGNLGPAFFGNYITSIKNGSRVPHGLAEGTKADKLAGRAFSLYEEELKKNNAFDFDDLLYQLVLLLRNSPERRRFYEAHFDHVLVDEYQDVNAMQYELLRFLVGRSGRVSVVGDDQQTIYSWRGSRYEFFLNFEKEWPGAHVVILEENYRSTSTIIEAASAVIAHNRAQKQKHLHTKNPPGLPITILETKDKEEEAEWVAEKIAERTRGNAPETLGVLFRTNAQSRAIEQALIARNISYAIFGGLKFYERREVKDVVAALRLVVNPLDSISRERLQKTLVKPALRALEALLQEKEGERTPHEWIEAVLRATSYFSYLETHFVNAREREENILELLRFSSTFADLTVFLERVSLLQATDRGEGDKAASVTLMTIHLAKGLEFDRVVLLGCAEGILPHARSLASEAEVEEERRLLYVAMTRARKELVIGFYDTPSRFISEIPSEHIEYKNLEAGGAVFEDSEERYITLD